MGDPSNMLILVLACGALLIRVGLGWYGSGMVRAKNAASAVFRNVIDIAIASLAFWAIGAAILNGGHSIFGIQAGLIFDAKNLASQSTFMQLVLVLIATAPVTMAVGERCKFVPAVMAPVLLAALVVPVCGAWAWGASGWLRQMGFVDIGGASVLHVVGGMTALIGAVFVGARSGKYNRDRSTSFIPGHNVPVASVGVLLMLAAWTPYVAGASMLHGGMSGVVGLNVLLAASAGAVVELLLSQARFGGSDVVLTYSGLLGGLVAMTAGGGAVSTAAAVCTGAIAGLLVPRAMLMIEMWWKIDDPSGLIAIQLVGGAWGTLAAGLFSEAAHWRNVIQHLGIQLLGLGVIAMVAGAAATALFALLRATIGLRLSEDAEYDGIDLSEHDLNAYPDFQQNMIKSYHLREG